MDQQARKENLIKKKQKETSSYSQKFQKEWSTNTYAKERQEEDGKDMGMLEEL
jgi:hypothetical protein